LEKRWFHRVLVVLNQPSGWPGWLIGTAALLPTGGVAAAWWLWVGCTAAAYLFLVLSLFILADALILASLPRWRISFGPVGPQLFTLLAPRLVLAAVAALPASWLGWMPVLAGVALINLLASALLLRGAVVEPQQLHLTEVSIAAPTWPENHSALRVLHVSDLHVERFGRREERLVQMVQQVEPDLILLTGDYVNLSYVDDPVAHEDARRLLEELAQNGGKPPRLGVYAVLGSPPVDRRSAPLFEQLPIHLLRDEVAVIDLPGSDGSSNGAVSRSRLVLLGLDCTHDPAHDAERLSAIASAAPPAAFRLLLYHSPELMPITPQYGVDLYLCGHTHGGQVRLPLYGAVLTSSKLGKRFEMGRYRLGDTHLYVSRGLGMEGMGAPRVRFLCPPEVVLFSLNREI
jgi:hypothetical protein